jgi:hypothetical protein
MQTGIAAAMHAMKHDGGANIPFRISELPDLKVSLTFITYQSVMGSAAGVRLHPIN